MTPTFSVGSCIVKLAPAPLLVAEDVRADSHGRVLSWEAGEAVVLWNPGSPDEQPDVLLPTNLASECRRCDIHVRDVEFPVRAPGRLLWWYRRIGCTPPGWLERYVVGAVA